MASAAELIRQNLEPFQRALLDAYTGGSTVSRSTATQTVGTFQSYLDAIKTGQMTTGNSLTTGNSFKWIPAKPKHYEDYLMDENMRNIVTLILAGMARANGGQIMLVKGDLGEMGDRIHLEADEKTGSVTVTLLPDYVKVGIEEELAVKPQYTLKYDTTPLTVGPGGTYDVFIDGKKVGATPVTWSTDFVEIK